MNIFIQIVVAQAAIAVSVFNLITYLWLGLTVLLNGNRASLVTWVGGVGLLGAALFFLCHGALVGAGVPAGPSPSDFWWRLAWLPAFVSPLVWAAIGLHYADLFGPWKRLRAMALEAVAALGILAAILALLSWPAIAHYGDFIRLLDTSLRVNRPTPPPAAGIPALPWLGVAFVVYVTCCALLPWASLGAARRLAQRDTTSISNAAASFATSGVHAMGTHGALGAGVLGTMAGLVNCRRTSWRLKPRRFPLNDRRPQRPPSRTAEASGDVLPMARQRDNSQALGTMGTPLVERRVRPAGPTAGEATLLWDARDAWARARRALLTASLLMMAIGIVVAAIGVLTSLAAHRAAGAPASLPVTLPVLTTRPGHVPVGLVATDLVVQLALAGVGMTVGWSVVRQGILVERRLPQRGFLSHWRGIVIVAAVFAAVIAGMASIEPVALPELLVLVALVSAAYALFTWQSYVAHDRTLAQLRPFVASLAGGHRGWLAADPHEVERSVEELFTSLCRDALGASRGRLSLSAGKLHMTVAYRASESEADPHDAREWALPVSDERGVVARLVFGPRGDGAGYTSADLEIARACGQRILDAVGEFAAAQAIAALARQRGLESELSAALPRRVLHDEVLPRLHLAMLRLDAIRFRAPIGAPTGVAALTSTGEVSARTTASGDATESGDATRIRGHRAARMARGDRRRGGGTGARAPRSGRADAGRADRQSTATARRPGERATRRAGWRVSWDVRRPGAGSAARRLRRGRRALAAGRRPAAGRDPRSRAQRGQARAWRRPSPAVAAACDTRL